MNYPRCLAALLLFLSLTKLSAQNNTNPCDFRWGNWQMAISNSSGGLYFAVQYAKCVDGGVCGWPKVALKHTFSFQAKFIEVKLGSYDCEGKYHESNFSTDDVPGNA